MDKVKKKPATPANIGNVRYLGYRLARQDNALFAPLLASLLMLWILFALAISSNAHGHMKMGLAPFDGGEHIARPLHTSADVRPDSLRHSVEWQPCVKI